MQETTVQTPGEHSSVGNQPDPATGETRGVVREIGGTQGPEPTRYGDWEKAGRCIDF